MSRSLARRVAALRLLLELWGPWIGGWNRPRSTAKAVTEDHRGARQHLPASDRRPDDSSLENSTSEGQTRSMEIRAPRRGLDRERSQEKSQAGRWRKYLEGGREGRGRSQEGGQRDEALSDQETPPEKGPWRSRAGQKRNLTRGSQEAPTQGRKPPKKQPGVPEAGGPSHTHSRWW